LSAATRQMHLGVFVLGAGNHSAGWRGEVAPVSNNDLAVIQEIARIAERGKFDLLFVSDGLDHEQGDLPSFMCRFEPTSLIFGVERAHDAAGSRRHCIDELYRTLQRSPPVRLDRP
jgi:alkanesulfonate monooxygenase SsuD/methylene tetrahydromethanopterin reductase-like flavin-dependent oxidoreductase (luciferase family)